MNTDGLFYEALIASYVDSPRFIPRPWLSDAVDRALVDPGCRFVLLTAEPGAGKTALSAWMAREHRDWLRYFIRRDQISPLGPPSARALLLQVGFQMAALHPELFTPKGIQLRVEQRVGSASHDSRIVAAEIQRLTASPFVQIAIQIRQDVERLEGSLTGLRVEEWIAEPRLIPIEDLQYLALLDPAASRSPAPTVVWIDALDELRHHRCESGILDWLETCPELPPHLRFVLTSRPDDDLLRGLRDRRGGEIREIPIRSDHPETRVSLDGDVSVFAQRWLRLPEVGQAVRENVPESGFDGFVDALVERAEGNLGYVVALARAFDQARLQKDRTRQSALLRLGDLPSSLGDLYAFFLHQIKARVRDQSLVVIDPTTGQSVRAGVWATVFRPILGALSIAREPVTAEQLQRMGDPGVGLSDVIDAVLELQQFLDSGEGRHRFHHATVAEFLTAGSTRACPSAQDLFVVVDAAHGRVLDGYQREVGGWDRPNWGRLDEYGWRHLTAHASGADVEGRRLVEMARAGFLRAKQAKFGGAAPLDDDWARVLAVVRHPEQFLDFVTFGYERSVGMVGSHALQNGRAARAAVRIALRLGDAAELRRIVGEIAILSPNEARVQLQYGILEQLAAGESSADPALKKELRQMLETSASLLPLEGERASWGARIAVLSLRTGDTTWDRAMELVSEGFSLGEKVALKSALARHAAQSSAHRPLAAPLLHQLLDEIAARDFAEDFVGDILQRVFHKQRESPAELLHTMLVTIIESSSSLPSEEVVGVLKRAAEQAQRISGMAAAGPASPESLALAMVQALHGAGLGAEAQACATTLLKQVGIRRRGLSGFRSPKTFPWWKELLSKCHSSGVRDLIPCAVLLPIVNEPQLTSAWQKQVVTGMSGVSSFDAVFAAFAELSNLAESGLADEALKPVVMELAETIRAVEGQPLFTLGASIAAAAAFLQLHDLARAQIEKILWSISATRLGKLEYPEQGKAWMWAFRSVWSAMCRQGDPGLVRIGLEWLLETTAAALPHDWRASLTAEFFESLKSLSSLELAKETHARLSEAASYTLDRPKYFATALAQFADAHAALNRPEVVARCLREAMGIAEAAPTDLQLRVEIACRAAPLWAEIRRPEEARASLQSALEQLPKMPGLNHQAGAMNNVLKAIVASAKHSEFKPVASVMLGDCFEIAAGIGSYEIPGMTATVEAHTWADLKCPEPLLSRLAERGLAATTAVNGAASKSPGRISLDQFEERIRLASALVRAGDVKSGRRVVSRLEQDLEQLSVEAESDDERAKVCRMAQLSAEFPEAAMNVPERIRPIHSIASGIQSPQSRVEACVAVARTAVAQRNFAQAALWLNTAIDAWHGIEDWMWAEPFVGGFFQTLRSISELGPKRVCLQKMESVIQRITDFYERDRARAQLALAFGDDAERFQALCQAISLPSGMDRILSAARDGRVSGPQIVGLVFELLERCTRMVPPVFLGDSLLVCQAAARQGFVEPGTVVGVLEFIERRMREFLRLDRSV